MSKGQVERLLAAMEAPILDPFMDSGTIGVACLARGLPYLGIEVDPGHYATACQCLEDHANATPSLAASGGRLAPAGAGAARAQPRV